jgi:long-subunit fatty acid transport protein
MLYFLLTGMVTILLFATSLFAAGVSVTGIGARATSLGGSYRAISDDWSGMYWNPAGITQINGWHVGLATELLRPVGTYKPALWNDSVFSVTRQTETRNEPQTFVAPCFGVVYKLSDKLTAGLGAWAPFGLGSKWDLLNTDGYNSAFPEYDYENDLKTFDIHPTVAYKLIDMISFGAGIGLVYADFMIRQPLFSKNPYFGDKIGGRSDYKDQSIYDNLVNLRYKDSLETVGGLSSNFSHLVAETELAVSGFGVGANLGVMAKINDQLQIGMSGRYYGNVKLNGKVNATMYYDTNAQAQQYLDSIWGDTTSLRFNILKGLCNKGDIKEYEKNGILNAYTGDTSSIYTNAKAVTTVPLPADVGIGISYKAINENDRHLILSSDFQYTFCSVWKVIDVDINDGEDDFQYVQNWNNSFRVSLWIEYKVNPVWTLRSAYFFEKNAGIIETLNPTFPDINPRNSVNLGFQFNIKPDIALHCGYEGIFFGKQSFDDWEYNYPNNVYDNMAGTYTLHVHNLMLGLDFNF